jgi:hypothetical protein
MQRDQGEALEKQIGNPSGNCDSQGISFSSSTRDRLNPLRREYKHPIVRTQDPDWKSQCSFEAIEIDTSAPSDQE